MSSKGLEKRIVSFIDSNVDKQGQYMFDIPICSPDILKNDTDTPIVISSVFHPSVYSSIKKMNCANPVYFFETRRPIYYEQGVTVVNSQDLYNLYENDDETKLSIDLCTCIRSFGDGIVLPYSFADYFPLHNDNYWDTDELSLDIFDSLTIIDAGAYTGDSIEYWLGR